MSEFIKSLALSLNAAGLSPRAITLFNQAKSASNFRWGQKSKAIAAACLAIALRESNRPDSLRDIASILDVPPTSVIREFTSITSTLKLSLTLVDPSVHIPTLQAHINSVLNLRSEESNLPKPLLVILGKLSLYDVADTANSLSKILARLNPHHDLLRLPMPPTACGIFILAMEAENRAVLNPLGDLAQCLGSRCHTSKGVVMARYKSLQDEVASWIEALPWLDKYESKKGRAKVSKRLVVARGLKDVIQFHEDVWKKSPKLELELGDDENKFGGEDDDDETAGFNEDDEAPTRSCKRPKLNHTLNHATQFLLDPLGTSVTSKQKTFNLPSHLSLATYLLTNSSTTTHRPPTRLQLLAHIRGGADQDHIPDEELFAEGEFERLLRSEDEIQVLRQTFGWKAGDEDQEKDTSSNKPRKRRKHIASQDNDDEIIHGIALSPRKKSRINMEALAKLLGDDPDNDNVEDEHVDPTMIGLGQMVDSDDDDDDDDGLDNAGMVHTLDAPFTQEIPQPVNYRSENDDDSEMILEGWRPPTPEYCVGDSRYEEEYD